jgi:quercetin dioxygenase-like cupin family protein
LGTEHVNKPAIPAGRVFDLSALVQYGEDAIVSRTLFESAAGTITAFAFDEGQGLSEHTTPFDALVQMIEGEGEFVVGGELHEVGTGQVILMPGGVPHTVEATTRLKMLLTMLQQDEPGRDDQP